MEKNFKSGYLITYKDSDRKSITQINYYLFGRIVSIIKQNKKQKYYYPGVLEKIKYKRIANGCYFVKELPKINDMLTIYPINIQILDSDMSTAKEYWKNKIDENVQNW